MQLLDPFHLINWILNYKRYYCDITASKDLNCLNVVFVFQSLIICIIFFAKFSHHLSAKFSKFIIYQRYFRETDWSKMSRRKQNFRIFRKQTKCKIKRNGERNMRNFCERIFSFTGNHNWNSSESACTFRKVRKGIHTPQYFIAEVGQSFHNFNGLQNLPIQCSGHSVN